MELKNFLTFLLEGKIFHGHVITEIIDNIPPIFAQDISFCWMTRKYNDMRGAIAF